MVTCCLMVSCWRSILNLSLPSLMHEGYVYPPVKKLNLAEDFSICLSVPSKSHVLVPHMMCEFTSGMKSQPWILLLSSYCANCVELVTRTVSVKRAACCFTLVKWTLCPLYHSRVAMPCVLPKRLLKQVQLQRCENELAFLQRVITAVLGNQWKKASDSFTLWAHDLGLWYFYYVNNPLPSVVGFMCSRNFMHVWGVWKLPLKSVKQHPQLRVGSSLPQKFHAFTIKC